MQLYCATAVRNAKALGVGIVHVRHRHREPATLVDIIDVGLSHVDAVLNSGSKAMAAELEHAAWEHTVVTTSCAGQGISEAAVAARLEDIKCKMCQHSPTNFTIYSAWDAFAVADNLLCCALTRFT